MSVSFGMFHLKSGMEFSVNGGLIIVSKSSEVYVLDMVYYENGLKEFLILNETKLDSPSSSRYDMLHLRKENEEVYFTLNLQVRYKN